MMDEGKQRSLRRVRTANQRVRIEKTALNHARRELAEAALKAYEAGVSTKEIAEAAGWRTQKSVYDAINPLRKKDDQ